MKIKQGKMRILLACADESLLKQTKRLMQASKELELVGCTSNGTKAWEMIRQKTPDMVVLDTDLPYADGFAVASWMRQNKMWDTSIILLSSFIGGQTYVECSLLHINVLLRKPICADALYERIKLAVPVPVGETRWSSGWPRSCASWVCASRRSAISVHC